MSDAGENDFGEEYERHTRRAHVAAYVLIAGLILEIVNAAIWFHGPETIASIVAVLLIVAGVWGEVHFGHKARLASDKQLAQYEARTAEANARASEAQLALEKFRKPWSLSVYKLPDFEKILKPFAGTPYRILTMNDHDPLRIAQILKRAFDWANWQPQPPRMPSPDMGIEFIPEYDGIDIRVAKERASEWLPAAQAVTDVFRSDEIEAEARVMESGTPPEAIHIFIGRKT